jgi:teichuronic acid biosynthesis glycosyltransferase TuaC
MPIKRPTLVLSFLYPSDIQPGAGVFIRERMLRVNELHPIVVVSPQPWSPFDMLIRFFKNPKYRQLPNQRTTNEDGFTVYRPRFLSVPGFGRKFDGISMAIATLAIIKRERLSKTVGLIDSHFAYPEGYAAQIVAKKLNLPYGITLRGARDTDTVGTSCEPMLKSAIQDASYVIGVSDALRKFAIRMGGADERAVTISNGVNASNFFPEDKAIAREKLGISLNQKVIVSVGSLIPLKGHERIVELMPNILKIHPDALFLIVGAPTRYADSSQQINQKIEALNLQKHVRLCGRIAPNELRWYLSSADVFALATENEGWPNALMEALACGLPVVTTNVGGNAEIVHSEFMGTVVPYWEPNTFAQAISTWLVEQPNREKRLSWAKGASWHGTAKKVAAIWSAI